MSRIGTSCSVTQAQVQNFVKQPHEFRTFIYICFKPHANLPFNKKHIYLYSVMVLVSNTERKGIFFSVGSCVGISNKVKLHQYNIQGSFWELETLLTCSIQQHGSCGLFAFPFFRTAFTQQKSRIRRAHC